MAPKTFAADRMEQLKIDFNIEKGQQPGEKGEILEYKCTSDSNDNEDEQNQKTRYRALDECFWYEIDENE